MKNILIMVLLVWFYTGCSETEVEHTYVTIEKDDVVVLDYTGLTQEFDDKDMSYREINYDQNATYVVFRLFADTQMSISLYLQLSCGTEAYVKYYGSQAIFDNPSGLEYGALGAITKQNLLDHNCLQEGGQTENIFAEVEGYAEYTSDKVTHVEHYVSSNTIEYTAQEINEAFAVFESQ